MLGLEEDDGAPRRKKRFARVRAAEAALARLDELEQAGPDDTAQRVRAQYQFRIDRFSARADPDGDGRSKGGR